MLLSSFYEDHGIEKGNLFLTPLRGQRRNGFWERGESSVQPPRWEKSPGMTDSLQASIAPKLALNSISLSIFDGDIVNCNRRFWNFVNIVEPIKLWELGKHIGITCCGDEE